MAGTREGARKAAETTARRRAARGSGHEPVLNERKLCGWAALNVFEQSDDMLLAREIRPLAAGLHDNREDSRWDLVPTGENAFGAW